MAGATFHPKVSAVAERMHAAKVKLFEQKRSKSAQGRFSDYYLPMKKLRERLEVPTHFVANDNLTEIPRDYNSIGIVPHSASPTELTRFNSQEFTPLVTLSANINKTQDTAMHIAQDLVLCEKPDSQFTSST
jgi:hypothetical protein